MPEKRGESDSRVLSSTDCIILFLHWDRKHYFQPSCLVNEDYTSFLAQISVLTQLTFAYVEFPIYRSLIHCQLFRLQWSFLRFKHTWDCCCCLSSNGDTLPGCTLLLPSDWSLSATTQLSFQGALRPELGIPSTPPFLSPGFRLPFLPCSALILL